MNRPHISVAMCTYNGSRYLWTQLQSIAAQTVLPSELIVCDDGSKDDTLELLRKFADESPFPVRIFSNAANLRTTKNFEKAIGLCNGDVIALSDQDDIWKPEKLERILSVFEQHPGAGYVFSDAEMVNDDGASLNHTLWEAHRLREGAIRKFDRQGQLNVLLQRNVATGAGMAFRASLRSVVLPISERWIHDYWIALLGSVFAYGVPISECLFQYRSHSSQQVGMHQLKKSIVEICGISMATTQEDYWKKLAAFQEIHGRAESAARDCACPPENLEQLRQKESHLSNRAAIHSSNGISRLRMLFSEALTGRYQRFSDSWRSVGRDLIPPSILADHHRQTGEGRT